jgi:glycosyltransferase involved in cell wall biosynthesis
MHIVQLLPELNQGGIERGVIELSQVLVQNNHKSTVISHGGLQTQKVLDSGASYIKFNCKGKNPLTFPFRLIWLISKLKKIKPDLIHSSSRVPCWFAYFSSRILGIPFISGIHGFHKNKVYNRVLNWSDSTIAASETLQKSLLLKYPKREGKIISIPRGVDLDFFDPEKIDYAWIEKMNFQKSKVFTIVGRITPWKDHETFIRAVALARKKGVPAVGLCVGRPKKEKHLNSLLQLCKTLGVESHIHFFDAKDHIREVYAMSTAVVSCSRRPEGFGRSLTEALAMGKPVYATEHGGALDIVKPGINGEFFQPGDYETLSKYFEKEIKFSSQALREYVRQKFSLKNMYTQTIALYQSLCIVK